MVVVNFRNGRLFPPKLPQTRAQTNDSHEAVLLRVLSAREPEERDIYILMAAIKRGMQLSAENEQKLGPIFIRGGQAEFALTRFPSEATNKEFFAVADGEV